MNNNVMWDKLQPLRAKMPRAVSETEVLRVAGVLLGDDPRKSAEAARQEVLRWVQKRCGGKLPREAWEYAEFDYRTGGRNSTGARIQSEAADIWAIRADDPDKTVAGRIWTTEVVVGFEKDDRPRFSARLMVSSTESNIEILPHSPGFVQQVAETVGLARGEYKISAEPWMIQSESDYLDLSEGLVDDARTLPFIILTVAENSLDREVPLLNASALARATVGLARVVIMPNEFTWRLTEDFGRKHSVFGGAVRVYLPGFSAVWAQKSPLSRWNHKSYGLSTKISAMNWPRNIANAVLPCVPMPKSSPWSKTMMAMCWTLRKGMRFMPILP